MLGKIKQKIIHIRFGRILNDLSMVFLIIFEVFTLRYLFRPNADLIIISDEDWRVVILVLASYLIVKSICELIAYHCTGSSRWYDIKSEKEINANE